MADQKPPREIGDERATLTSLLQYQRESFARKVVGIDDEQARRSPVASGTTLLWLTKHLARAEHVWLVHRFLASEEEPLDDVVRDDDTIAGALTALRATWRRMDAIIAGGHLDDLARRTGGEPPVDLRWIVAHLLEEVARHAGHADILRELIDGETGR
jgi:hypothetical protein